MTQRDEERAPNEDQVELSNDDNRRYQILWKAQGRTHIAISQLVLAQSAVRTPTGPFEP